MESRSKSGEIVQALEAVELIYSAHGPARQTVDKRVSRRDCVHMWQRRKSMCWAAAGSTGAVLCWLPRLPATLPPCVRPLTYHLMQSNCPHLQAEATLEEL